jgi:hypothetical protein
VFRERNSLRVSHMSQGFPRTSSQETLLFAEISQLFRLPPVGPTFAPWASPKRANQEAKVA